jgi:hypothetical protein
MRDSVQEQAIDIIDKMMSKEASRSPIESKTLNPTPIDDNLPSGRLLSEHIVENLKESSQKNQPNKALLYKEIVNRVLKSNLKKP